MTYDNSGLLFLVGVFVAMFFVYTNNSHYTGQATPSMPPETPAPKRAAVESKRPPVLPRTVPASKGAGRPRGNILTTEELLPVDHNAWSKYGSDTFVPTTKDLLASVASQKRTFSLQNQLPSKHNRTAVGQRPFPPIKAKTNNPLLSTPDGYMDPLPRIESAATW